MNWLLLFVVIMLAGVGLVLALWPKGKTTQTINFWLLLVGTPALTYMAMLGVRLSVYHRACLRKEVWDQRSARLAQSWAAWGQRHQWVSRASVFLAAGTHADQWLNEREGLPVNLDRAVPLGLPFADSPRQWLTYLLSMIAERFAKEIGATHGTLHVQILLDAETADALRDERFDVGKILQQLLAKLAIDTPLAVEVHPEIGFDRLGEWADRRLDGPMLLIAAQRASSAASTKFSEGAAACWLRSAQPDDASAPDDARMFRPMVSTVSTLADDLQHLHKTQCGQGVLADIWHTGLDGHAQGVVLAAVSAMRGGHAAQEREAHEHKLDEVVGRAGPVSGWIALGLAAQAAVRRRCPQIVVSAGKAGTIVIGTVDMDVAG
ncbi:MAG: hypothetical protein JO278_01260 [Dyella sp.]|nr:hypothetical protein [Dyella sp.]